MNALFLSDFGYNKVHLWVVDDISKERIVTWREEFKHIKSQYLARNPTVYLGHGDPTDMTLVDTRTCYCPSCRG